MTSKVDSTLQEQIDAAKRDESHRAIPVIVTVAQGTDPSILGQSGLQIQRAVESISAICGTIKAEQVEAVAKLDQVSLIEYDGQTHAV